MLSEVYSVVCILWGALRVVQCLICNALGDVQFYFICYMVLVPSTARCHLLAIWASIKGQVIPASFRIVWG